MSFDAILAAVTVLHLVDGQSEGLRNSKKENTKGNGGKENIWSTVDEKASFWLAQIAFFDQMKAFCYSIEKLTYDSVNNYFNSETVKLNLNHVDAKDS